MKATGLANDDLVRPWIIQAKQLVANRLADARAHAAIVGPRSTAHERVDAMGRELASLLGAARAAFYRDSFSLHRTSPDFDRDVHDLSIGPSAAGEKVARTAKIGGQDQYVDLKHLVDSANEGLNLVAATDQPNDAAQLRLARWSLWERTNRDALWSGVSTALSDAQMSLFNSVGHIMIRPERR